MSVATSPQISIVISCFNYARYVAAAIDSALAQTYGGVVEVVVVDDGSTDGSAAVIERYRSRIRVLQQHNQGQVAALNHGYSEAMGEVVIFLDADDVLLPTAAECVATVWRPDCAKVQYNLEIIGSTGEMLGRRFCDFPLLYGPAEIREEFRRYATYQWPVSSGNAYSRWFLEQVMPLAARMAPDGLLNTIAPLFGDVLVIQQPLGCYRIHSNNQSYHGAGAGGVARRFIHQIALRRDEARELGALAARRGVQLPAVDLLDHELVFINYRLMVLKLGQFYEGSHADSVARLWCRAIKVLSVRALPGAVRLKHATWMTALALTPQWLARHLIALRFNRGSYLRPVGRATAALRSLVQRTR